MESKEQFGKHVSDRVLLNPEMDPHFIYPNLKAFAILFDQVVIWSPNEAAMEANGFSLSDIENSFEATGDGRPVFLPGGRSNYFDFDARAGDKAFRHRQRERAEASGSIAPHEARDAVYGALAELRRTDPTYWDTTFRDLHAHFDSHNRNPTNYEKVVTHARKFGTTVEYALAGEFLLEARTCEDINRQSRVEHDPSLWLKPFADTRHTEAYGYFQLRSAIKVPSPIVENLSEDIADLRNTFESDARFLSQTIKHIELIFTAHTLNWQEILEVRRIIGTQVRERYSLRSGVDERNVDSVISAVKFWLNVYVLARFATVAQIDHLISGVAGYMSPELAGTYSSFREGMRSAGAQEAFKSAFPFVMRATAEKLMPSNKAVCRFDLAELQLDRTLARAILRPSFRFASLSSHVAAVAADSRHPERTHNGAL